MSRAVILTLDPARGGVPALAHATCRWLAAVGHTPELLYRADGEPPTTSRWAAAKYFLTTPPIRRKTYNGITTVAVADYPAPARWKYHLLRMAVPTLGAPIAVVVSGSSHVGLPLALARRPYVLWVATIYEEELRGRALAGDKWAEGFLRHPDWPELQAQEQMVCERASAILGLSPHTTTQIAARWPDIRGKLRTVAYPIDTDRFRPGEKSGDAPYVLLIARIRDPRKNTGLLLRAFARVRAEFPRLRLIVAGDQPLPAISALTAGLGLGEAVTFPGYISDEEKLSLLQGATLFVLPSLQEGLGISALEAMACGLPVISTRCGGPEGFVQDGITGVLAPNNDEAALARAMMDLLSQPARARAMGAAGREHTVRHFADEQVHAQLRSTFKEVFGGLF